LLTKEIAILTLAPRPAATRGVHGAQGLVVRDYLAQEPRASG
jgi:hypothetical protein